MGRKRLTKKEKRSKYNVSLTDKFEHNGVKFRSKLEVNHYKYFLEHPKITVLEFEPFFLLFEGFEYYDFEKDKMRKFGKFSYKSDFKLKIKGVDKPIIWESKGMLTQASALRIKIWRMIYGGDYNFVMSKSLKHCKKFFEDLEVRLNEH